MALTAPAIDDRNFDDIVNQALALAKQYCPEWQAKAIKEGGDSDDAGTALIYLFARLMEIIICRLNRVPEKNLLAFLDFIGARLHPPTPARALLQFTLSEGSAENARVPAGTQVSTEESGAEEEQVFETERDLVVTPVKLERVFTVDSLDDTGQDRTALAAGVEDGAFEVLKGKDSALYLGFDAPFANDSVTLFFKLTEETRISRELLWEYSSAVGWNRLRVQDETQSFSVPGHIRFIGPKDFNRTEKFGLNLCWLRVRLLRGPGDKQAPANLQRVYMNTVWSENVETVKDELLGSSDGSAGQVFKLNQCPVLPGQQVWVVEPEIPADAEYERIVKQEGQDAVEITRDDEGNIEQIRVRWHAVENFYTSSDKDRHYIIEPASGKLTFGDSIRGMIPPLGTDNIRCSRYRIGGGQRGNVEKGKISQIKTSLPYIDSVTNVEHAHGGADGETVEEVKERGPYMLKHRDRAVTAEDFEWLMQEAPGEIAVSKCIPAKDRSSSGLVTVIIVPDLDEPKPYPAQGLIRQVEHYLYERCPVSLVGGLAPCVQVTGPGYIEISVEATIVPKSIEQAGQVEERALAGLENFFHPLKGGPEGNGWPFGRDVYLSEVMEVLQKTGGVDYVKSLRFTAPAQAHDLDRVSLEPHYLVYSGKHSINMVLE